MVARVADSDRTKPQMRLDHLCAMCNEISPISPNLLVQNAADLIAVHGNTGGGEVGGEGLTPVPLPCIVCINTKYNTIRINTQYREFSTVLSNPVREWRRVCVPPLYVISV